MPSLYFLIQIGIFFQPKAIRLNNYLFGFHPNLPLLEVDTSSAFHLSAFICQFFHELLIITFLVYLFFSVKTIRIYNQKMKQYFATQKSKYLKYNFSIFLSILLALATLIFAVITINFQTDLGEKYLMLIPLIGIFALGFLMLSGAPFFDKAWLLEKYHTSGLNISSLDILKKIIVYVESEKYYLKKNGSLKDLATQLALSPTYLSQVINNQTHQNFNDFINQYRIEEAKKRLVDESFTHLSIAGIGETVGFKSKSSFYSVFKKHTNLTPAAYIKVAKV